MTIAFESLNAVPAAKLKPLFENENKHWIDKLGWDNSLVHRHILRYAPQGFVQGVVLMDDNRAIGYSYIVVQGDLALLGSIFVHSDYWGLSFENLLAESIVKLVQGVADVKRIEAQPMILSGADVSQAFEMLGCRPYLRHYLSLPMPNWEPRAIIPDGIRLIPWKEKLIPEASKLILDSYEGGVDTEFASNFASLRKCEEFTKNLVLRQGCGDFLKSMATVAVDEAGVLAGVVITSKLMSKSGHLPQISVSPGFQGRKIGAYIVAESLNRFKKAGYQTVSLTVTSKNERANSWYRRLGFKELLSFHAFVWDRS